MKIPRVCLVNCSDRHLGNNLYVDSKSNIYFKTHDHNDLPVLISRLYNGCEGDSSYDLKKNIDLATFREIGYDYYADKKRVFFHSEMSDGGNIVIAHEIDVMTFKLFPKSFYGYDKKGFTIKVQLWSWQTGNHLNVFIN